ncbi:MAG TPA: ribonuclease PH [Chloroflexi bacterium]|nr:ribonuclease PH [Chloroflexota bacterium]
MIEQNKRVDNRHPGDLRNIAFILHYVKHPEGSVLIKMGDTHVLCNVSIEEGVPHWMTGQGAGWLTAEYALLPRSTHTRTRRETHGPSARTQEVRRMIGRSLRAAIDLEQLGERTLIVDCDVLQADGGTRTAAITGGYVALALALRRLIDAGATPPSVLKAPVAAVSIGIVDGDVYLDLCYAEDHQADVDLNIVMQEGGQLIEIQGTAERKPFSRQDLNRMLELANRGISTLIRHQREALVSA